MYQLVYKTPNKIYKYFKILNILGQSGRSGHYFVNNNIELWRASVRIGGRVEVVVAPAFQALSCQKPSGFYSMQYRKNLHHSRLSSTAAVLVLTGLKLREVLRALFNCRTR